MPAAAGRNGDFLRQPAHACVHRREAGEDVGGWQRQALVHVPRAGRDRVLVGRKVMVDRTDAHARARGDVGHGRRGDALLAMQRKGGVDQPPAGLSRRFRPPFQPIAPR